MAFAKSEQLLTKPDMEAYRSGHNGPDSKSGIRQRIVGSNPTASAKRQRGWSKAIPLCRFVERNAVGFEPVGPAKSNDFVGKGAASTKTELFKQVGYQSAWKAESSALAATQSHRFRENILLVYDGIRTMGLRKVGYITYGAPVKSSDFAGKRSHSDANGDFQERKRESFLKVGVHVACGDVEPQRNGRSFPIKSYLSIGKRDSEACVDAIPPLPPTVKNFMKRIM